jgi:hypothetical protein
MPSLVNMLAVAWNKLSNGQILAANRKFSIWQGHGPAIHAQPAADSAAEFAHFHVLMFLPDQALWERTHLANVLIRAEKTFH